jgi:hypothetical protein
MFKVDWTLKAILMTIALFLGMMALRPLVDPVTKVMAQPARFDHVLIVSAVFIYKGATGLLVLDQRNANVWFIPKVDEQYGPPVFVLKLPFDKLDQAPQ